MVAFVVDFLMKDLVHLRVDDFPDFLLAGFVDHKKATGRYPHMLYINALLAEMMQCRPGIWGPTIGFPGVWGWLGRLTAEAARGKDEFGYPE